jgi:hypothetical protein
MENKSDNMHSKFRGTYFIHENILRLSLIARIMAWLVLGAFIIEWLYPISILFYQNLIAPTPLDMKAPGIVQSLLINLSNPFIGGVMFIILQVVGQMLLILLDMEDNSRQILRYLGTLKK